MTLPSAIQVSPIEEEEESEMSGRRLVRVSNFEAGRAELDGPSKVD